MVYMACCPGIGKRAAQLLALAALCVAAFWFGLRDPPTNIINIANSYNISCTGWLVTT
jgi:hypothetical protein